MRNGTTTTAGEVIDEANRGLGCLGRAHADEPVFVIRAKDVIFTRAVRYWLEEARAEGASDAKIAGAQAVLADGVEWRAANGTKVPD